MMMQDEESDSAPVLQRKWIKDQMKKRCQISLSISLSLPLSIFAYYMVDIVFESRKQFPTLSITDLPPSFPIFDVSDRETSVIPQFSQYFAVLGM
jgi:hypothetical protein